MEIASRVYVKVSNLDQTKVGALKDDERRVYQFFESVPVGTGFTVAEFCASNDVTLNKGLKLLTEKYNGNIRPYAVLRIDTEKDEAKLTLPGSAIVQEEVQPPRRKIQDFGDAQFDQRNYEKFEEDDDEVEEAEVKENKEAESEPHSESSESSLNSVIHIDDHVVSQSWMPSYLLTGNVSSVRNVILLDPRNLGHWVPYIAPKLESIDGVLFVLGPLQGTHFVESDLEHNNRVAIIDQNSVDALPWIAGGIVTNLLHFFAVRNYHRGARFFMCGTCKFLKSVPCPMIKAPHVQAPNYSRVADLLAAFENRVR